MNRIFDEPIAMNQISEEPIFMNQLLDEQGLLNRVALKNTVQGTGLYMNMMLQVVLHP
jgi:hypothetical protein